MRDPGTPLGFDRPPAREFDSIAEHWPGHMLVTASAKFGPPAGFVASEGEVGSVGDLPVYLGVRGWGYTVDEALIPKVEKDGSGEPRPPACRVGTALSGTSGGLRSQPSRSGWSRSWLEKALGKS